MPEPKSQHAAYRSILKATTLLGSVRVVSTVVTILKYKIVAVALGASGVGFFGIYVSALGVITAFADLGLSKSSVRTISWAKGNGDDAEVARVISVLGKMIWWLAAISALITFSCSRLLSVIVFGDGTKDWCFALLALAVLFQTVSTGQLAIMQGLRELKALALATVIGAITGLVLSSPLFLVLGEDGIVPSIVVSCLISLLVSVYFLRKLSIREVLVRGPQAMRDGKEMLILGVSMMVMSAIVALSGFAIRAYITSASGVEDVGVFHAGYTVITGYFGVITTAMVTDYFPRISALSADNERLSEEVNRQCIVILLLITPLTILMALTAPCAVSLLFSSELKDAELFVKWAIFGVVLQPVGQSLGMVLLAKNDSRIFVSSVLLLQGLFLLMNVVMFNYSSIAGLGIAYSVNMLLNMVFMYFLLRLKYNIQLSPLVLAGSIVSTFSILLVLWFLTFESDIQRIFLSWSIFLISLLYCLKKMSFIMGITNFSKVEKILERYRMSKS